ncbi:protein of unknown function [Candidatus Methylomirabilis oxygeniifera]|uniref:Uncharacterized protein n=1 Tax=Methylomirabilis oxygeniifera TaxID=671143 RepID=D5MJD0_METO1|nr:protein of unknown function [Candidatus Methylomirabilis oxyfera]
MRIGSSIVYQNTVLMDAVLISTAPWTDRQIVGLLRDRVNPVLYVLPSRVPGISLKPQ